MSKQKEIAMAKQKEIKLNMKCPECKVNNWKLKYRGDSDDGYNDKTRNINNWFYVFGILTMLCLHCGYSQYIYLGMDD